MNFYKSPKNVYKIPNKYKFPLGIDVQEIEVFRYEIPKFNISSVKKDIYPKCKNGWFIIDIVNTNSEIISTLGRI